MNYILIDRDYKNVFRFFNEISGVPRGSHNNTAISNYLVDFAKSRNLEYIQDEFENVVIFKEATKGYEDSPAIILQGHMDMVCEKTPESNHDFVNDGLDLLVDGDYLYANNTTLGADNGIAIAYALAFLDDNDLKHPRLEAVFTTDEEVGMDGAIGLDVSVLQGKYLINMDSGEEGTLLISSAGGLTASCEIPLVHTNVDGLKIQIAINNLKGGHSGAEIHRNRTNATKLLGRLLFELKESFDYHLISIEGGQKDNVIPRDAYAEICIDPDSYDEFETLFETLSNRYQSELSVTEPDLTLNAETFESKEYKCIDEKTFEKILLYLIHVPNGVQKMSGAFDDLVESSLNIGVLRMNEESAVFRHSVRSSINSYKGFISNKLDSLGKLVGGNYYVGGQYPAWEYKVDSPLRDHMEKVYKEMYNEKPILAAIHAGLECSFFAGKIPDVDIVSLGPDMDDIHTPQERLNIPSTIRVYKYLEKVIENI